MFKKNEQQTIQNRRRQPVPVEQGKIFSYRSNRSEDVVPRHRLRPEMATTAQNSGGIGRNWLSWRYAPTFLAMLAIIVCIAYNMLLSSTPRIIVSGTADERALLRDTSVYVTAIRKELENSFWNRTKVTFNTNNVAQSLTRKFPEVESLRVALPVIGQKPIIYIVPTLPRVILETNNGTYVVDANGKAITDITDKVLTPVLRVRDESGVTVALGTQAVPQRSIVFIAELQRQLLAKKITATQYILPAASQSVVVMFQNKQYMGKFTFQQDVLQQAGAFIATYEKLEETSTEPVNYIDVRVPERVYVK